MYRVYKTAGGWSPVELGLTKQLPPEVVLGISPPHMGCSMSTRPMIFIHSLSSIKLFIQDCFHVISPSISFAQLDYWAILSQLAQTHDEMDRVVRLLSLTWRVFTLSISITG